MGRINNVVILTDKEVSEGPIGDTLLYYFESAYPIMPAEEPMFDVRFMMPEDLNAEPLKRELRIYVIVADVSDTLSSTTKLLRADMGAERFSRALKDSNYTTSVGNDKWARDQLLVYIFANGKDNLAKAIRQNFPNIARRINTHDEKNLQATVYGIRGENKTLSGELLDSFGVHIRIPDLFVKAMEKTNFLWLRMDNKDMNQSLVFRKFPYKNASQLTMENIIKLRNEYGKEFIHTGFADAYMSTNVIDLPTYEYTYTHNGVYVKEVRGIWETVNDFMGGPFISYVLYNEAKGEIVFIDAFVF
ncbi:MAG: DUF4837 family protein, partial [Saprospiraceae bacterium]|nr:DUF4837 family protein [Saprospiraceae bacterium]